ncbi:hypothetical protein D915_005618 [Fasciola hepatica]|uniref:Uncharacterized protein n=1 Tax=Fasciola hepatica TaxID=6192 RepID=A0A4E0R9G3_FASHE|nr:hypothetical protein D915_005618 [Fasciola hepatica]
MCFSLTSQLPISCQFLAGLQSSVTGQLVVSLGCSGNLPKSHSVPSFFSRRDFNVAQYKITVQQFANANINVKAVINPPEHSLVIVKEPFLWRHGGPTLKNDQPKSHKVLEQQIPRASVGGGKCFNPAVLYFSNEDLLPVQIH